MYRTKRLCKNCGKIFNGGVDKTLCDDCAKISRAENVVRSRVCVSCGRSFNGGPRARQCPECRRKKKRENKKPERKLGSIDKCIECGKEYIVKGSLQKYCPDCKREAVLRWQRNRKIQYNRENNTAELRRERRKDRTKVCAYCLRPFWSETETNTCSDYCRQQNKRLSQARADIKRGRGRNTKQLEVEMEKYREKAREEVGLINN